MGLFRKKNAVQVQAKLPAFITGKITKKQKKRARRIARLLKVIFRETRYS